MNEKINIRKALRAFNRIITEGEREGNEFTLNGLTAQSSFDGYTASLGNEYVQLDIFFHSKFSFTYTSKKERDLFLEKIDKLDR